MKSVSPFLAFLAIVLLAPVPWCAAQVPPANDSFANRVVLQGSAVVGQSTTVGATREAFEPIFPDSRDSTVWWTWTAPTAGTVNIDTGGSSLSPYLSVFNGSSIDTLKAINVIASDTNGNTVMTFPTVAGVAYQISVGSYTDKQGPVELNIHITNPTDASPFVVESEAATNDNFAQASVLTGAAVTGFGFNLEATREPFEAPGSGDGTLWWAWTAPANGTLAVDSAGTLSGNILGAFTGTTLSDLTVVGAAEMKFGFDDPASFVLSVTGGTTYYFSIGGDPNVGGPGRIRTEILNLNFASASPQVPQVSVAATDSVAHLGGAPGVYTFSISTAQSQVVKVHYKLKGSAINGTDYARLGGTVKIKPGKTSANVQVTPKGDLEGAGSKKLKLVLEPASAYSVETAGATVIKILNH